jgi:Domain of unknown function (DUF4333)
LILSALLGLTVGLASCSSPTPPTAQSPSPAVTTSPTTSPSLAAKVSPSPTASVSPSPAASPAATGNKTEATKSIEASIINALSAQIPSPITAANCPNLEKLEAGKEFDCTLTVAEGTFPGTVTLKDSKGDFAVKTKNILMMPALETLLVTQIKQENKLDVKVDCGSNKVRLFKAVGESFECKIAPPNGKSGTATVTVTTPTGGVDAKWQIEQ